MNYNPAIEEQNREMTMNNKELIIQKFNENVRGRSFIQNENNNHDGNEGHWLEQSMGINPNGVNEPDIHGYEMKKQSLNTTFIDKKFSNIFLRGDIIKRGNRSRKDEFWTIFQRSSSDGIRIGGWKLDWDVNGQKLFIDEDNNIIIKYNYFHDQRENKDELVPEYYKNNEDHKIMEWEKKHIKEAINSKWNVRGWFICKKNNEGVYDKICFGEKFDFDFWIERVRDGIIYYDGYSKIDGRWRGCFRSSSNWFYKLIKETY